MDDVFAKLKKSGAPVAITGKDEGAFFTGFVEEADEEFIILRALSPSGHFDGFACIRIEEIARADVATEYLTMLARVHAYYGEAIALPKLSSRDILGSFIDQAIKNKWLCSVELGFETLDKLTGYFVERDFDTVQMNLVGASGKPDGFTTFDFEEIVFVTALGEREAYLETVMRLLLSDHAAKSEIKRGATAKNDLKRGDAQGDIKPEKNPDGDKQKGKHEKKDRVISFPKKDD
ncbi:MAG: hypothetical protein SPH68_08505 [Candidatus Borkfalkiaceae bacterium]|nr:hypothetical protein [Clostridia bacterium]MDY6224181.1 hypothetical protein [Christensenellaceae bacterium]